MSANRIIKERLLAQVAPRLSKPATVEALPRYGDLSLNLGQVYKSMDDLDEAVIDTIRQRSCEVAEKVCSQPVQGVFYDTATLYFESEQSDVRRSKGCSKDGPSHRVPVVFALLSTEDGLPLGDELFAGHLFEGQTLIKSQNQALWCECGISSI